MRAAGAINQGGVNFPTRRAEQPSFGQIKGMLHPHPTGNKDLLAESASAYRSFRVAHPPWIRPGGPVLLRLCRGPFYDLIHGMNAEGVQRHSPELCLLLVIILAPFGNPDLELFDLFCLIFGNSAPLRFTASAIGTLFLFFLHDLILSARFVLILFHLTIKV